MALQVQSFTGITPDKFLSLVAKVGKDTGVAISGDSGTAKSDDEKWEFSWDYNSTEGTLAIQCLKKPFYIPASSVITAITHEVAEL